LQNGDKPLRIVSTYILEKGQPISLPAQGNRVKTRVTKAE
jgi:hypothetical protein